MHASTIVGYTYQADNHCRDCIVGFFPRWDQFQPLVTNGAEGILDAVASLINIDRNDESSFDSGDFPKVIFADMVEEGERCGGCGEVLV